MKEIERKLFCELVKNCRRSDKELAHDVGCSQPTVTRARRKLEKEGYIREYTVIPDFHKLGYELLSLIFVKLRKGLDREGVDKAIRIAQEGLPKTPFAIIMMERGRGLEYDGVVLSLLEDYTSHVKLMSRLRQFTFLDISTIDSFIVSLSDEVHYRPLTFAPLAKHLLAQKEK